MKDLNVILVLNNSICKETIIDYINKINNKFDRNIKFNIIYFNNINKLLNKYKPIYDFIFIETYFLDSLALDIIQKIRKIDQLITIFLVSKNINEFEDDSYSLVEIPPRFNSINSAFMDAISKYKRNDYLLINLNKSLYININDIYSI